MTVGSFRVQPDAVRSISKTVEGLSSSAQSATSDLSSLVLDAMSFATIGSPVASANASLQQQLVGGLSKFVKLINDINSHIQTAANDYDQSDQSVAQGFGGGGQGSASTGGDGTQATPAQTDPAAQPAQTAPNQVDPRVVDSIMRSEGTGGEQGGVREVYGFRQSMHNGYDQIMAARNQYGVGSAQERAVVTDLMTENARRAGAMNFTDPGTQAAIMSGAHMRGNGGVQAILNHMAGDPIVRSGTLTPEATQHLQGLTPEQFQQDFRDARLEYDRQIYGNTTTHQGGHTANWWDRYGNGLTQRYDREQIEFGNLNTPAAPAR